MIYLNNKIVPRNKAFISVFDHGFLYGDGVYETLRSYKGVVFKIDEHIERLFRSAALICLKVPKTHEMIKKAVYDTLRATKEKEAVVRITVSRGAGPIGLDPALCPASTFVIIPNVFKEYPESCYKKGLKTAIVNIRRNFKGAIDPQIKSLNFLNNILAKIEAKKKNADEAIMLNHNGYVADGTVTNIFFVRDRTLHTPSLDVGILDGVTRRIILDSAIELGIRVKEGYFRKNDLHLAKEVFISNTTMEVMPVAELDDVRVGPPGIITKALHKAYRKKVDRYVNEDKKQS